VNKLRVRFEDFGNFGRITWDIDQVVNIVNRKISKPKKKGGL